MLAEACICECSATNTNNGEILWQHALAEKTVEGGDEFSFGQIARGTENNDTAALSDRFPCMQCGLHKASLHTMVE